LRGKWLRQNRAFYYKIEITNMKNWLKSFVHNVIVHPLMMVLPTDLAHYMHDKNAYWAFGPFTCDELDLEGVKTP